MHLVGFIIRKGHNKKDIATVGKYKYFNNNNNKSVIMKSERAVFIDVAIPGDKNVIKKVDENILKYKDLTTAKERMWNVTIK